MSVKSPSVQTPSLQKAIAVLQQHREKLEARLGVESTKEVLFNLKEIELDLQDVADRLVEAVTGEDEIDRIGDVLSDFQYGSIPHILGHLEEIEKELDRRRDSEDLVGKTNNGQERTLDLQKPKETEKELIKIENWVKQLKESEENTRCQAATALGEIGNEIAIPALCEALSEDSSIEVRIKAARALGEISKANKDP